jgi:endonuclease/exonuclease/phosphatase family metal-dependent hydrolase
MWMVGLAPLGCGGPLDGDETAWTDPAATLAANLDGSVRVRVMAANLTSGNGQSYDPGHGGRLMQSVRPDIVMIQEFNVQHNTAAELRAFVDQHFGPSYQYARQGGMQIPNGVISAYPILASGTWSDREIPNRDFVWARIDVPGPKDLWAVSVHLSAGSSAKRRGEARDLVQYIRQTVPPDDYLVLGGDFNSSGRGDVSVRTLSEVLVTSGPFPADQRGNGNTSASRSKPLDWVLLNGPLQARSAPVVVGSNTFHSGLVLDSRVYSPLEDLQPARWEDSGSRQMQHMGVVRDVLLPCDGPTP